MSLLNIISKEMSIPEELLSEALINARLHVKHLQLTKRNGGLRTVYQPSKKLKIIQYWLIKNVFNNIRVHESASAYVKNISIKDNAYKHKNKRFLLKLDFENFFPSITYADLEPIFKEWHKQSNVKWEFSIKTSEIIRLSCFYKDDRLPIGYPTSPILSNIVMYPFDYQISSNLSLDKNKYGQALYSRYSDDLVFSTDKIGACKEMYALVNEIISAIKAPCLNLNDTKTRYLSSSGGSSVITGLRLCHDGHLTVHRDYKNKLRGLIHLYESGKLQKKDVSSLIGHLAHIKHVDPVFFTKLQKKSFLVIEKLLKDE